MAKRNRKQDTVAESPMEFDDTARKNAIEWQAVKAAWRNTRKWKILIIVFILLGLISPVITIRQVNNITQMGRILGGKYREMNAAKPGRQAALQAVNEWLDTTKGGFRSGTDNLWWDDANKVGETTKSDGSNNGDTTEYWSHHLSFTDLTDGSTRDVTQLVAVTDGIATAVGEPTLLPKQVTSNNTNTYTPDGYQRLDQPESFANVATAWAKAYVGKDSAAFTVIVGDPNADHAYQPAAIGTMKNVGVNWMVVCTKTGQATSKDDKNNENPEYGCASLTISFNPFPLTNTGNNDGDGSNSDDTTNSTRSVKTNVTVLVRNPTRGSAKIVDWGADGSLTTLSPYANAVDKSLLNSTTSTDEDSGTGTDSTTGSGDTGASDGSSKDTAPDSGTDTPDKETGDKPDSTDTSDSPTDDTEPDNPANITNP